MSQGSNPPEHDAQQQAAELGRIQFGPAAGNSIPAEWAAPLLVRLHAANPYGFGQQLMELYAQQRLGQTWRVVKPRETKTG